MRSYKTEIRPESNPAEPEHKGKADKTHENCNIFELYFHIYYGLSRGLHHPRPDNPRKSIY